MALLVPKRLLWYRAAGAKARNELRTGAHGRLNAMRPD